MASSAPLRDWRRSPAVATVAVIVLAIAVYRIVAGGARPEPRPIPIDILCTACGKQDRASVRGRPPYPCPQCGKPAAYRAMKCRAESCGHVFAYDPMARAGEGMTDRLDAIEAPRQCPKCKSRNVGTVTPPEQLPKVR